MKLKLKQLFSSYTGKFSSLLKNGAGHVFLGSFITKFITFFGSIFLVRLLSKPEYGVLSYYENIIGYFMVFAGLGMAAGTQRFLILSDTIEEKKGCFNHALKRGNIWNFILCLVCAVFCMLYRHPDAFNGYPQVILFLILCVPFIYSSNLSLYAYRALFDYKLYAYLAIVAALLSVAGRILGAVAGGLNYSVIGRFGAEFISAVLCVIALYSIHFKDKKAIKPATAFVKEFDRYSLQIMFTDGLWTIFMLNDILLLGQLSGSDVMVADYKIAYVIPANLSIIASSICVFTGPYFTKREKEGDKSWVKTKLKESVVFTMLIIGLLAFLCFVLGSPLIRIMYGEQYLSALPIMNILLLASFFNNGIRMVVANFLSAIGEQKSNLIVAGIGIVAQVILDIILIPRMGALGVGLSSLLVYIIMSLLLIILVRKFFLR